MKLAKVLGLVAVAFFVGLIIVGCSFYNGYNKAVTLNENVNSAWPGRQSTPTKV